MCSCLCVCVCVCVELVKMKHVDKEVDYVLILKRGLLYVDLVITNKFIYYSQVLITNKFTSLIVSPFLARSCTYIVHVSSLYSLYVCFVYAMHVCKALSGSKWT